MFYSVAIFKMREDNFGYLIFNKDSAICIDPFDYKLIYLSLHKELKELKIYDKESLEKERNLEKRRKMLFCLNTHHHFDHSGGNDGLKKLLKDEFIFTKNNINLPGLTIQVINTPCHTMDSVCFYMKSKEKYLFTGDTVFYLGCGRFFEGNENDMYNSLKKIVNEVDKDTLMMYGHDYSEKNCLFVENVCKLNVPTEIKSKKFLSLKEEMLYNPFILSINKSKEELKRLRDQKDSFGLGSK